MNTTSIEEAAKESNLSNYSMNFPIGSDHWFNTLMANVLHIGEYMKTHKCKNDHYYHEWGEQVYNAAKDILNWRQASQPTQPAEANLFLWLKDEANILKNSTSLMWKDEQARFDALKMSECIDKVIQYIELSNAFAQPAEQKEVKSAENQDEIISKILAKHSVYMCDNPGVHAAVKEYAAQFNPSTHREKILVEALEKIIRLNLAEHDHLYLAVKEFRSIATEALNSIK